MPTIVRTAKVSAPSVERELERVTRRIRLNDLFVGGLALAVWTMGFAALAMCVDRSYNLDADFRKLGLALYLGVFALITWRTVVRPLRRAINPRFAARRVESTLDGEKNSVINWVDLHEEELPDSIQTAITKQASKELATADLDRASESKLIPRLGAAAGILFACLLGMFVHFKPGPFLSLISRSFNPFVFTKIASRTEIILTSPETGDVTVTAGSSLDITVHIRGAIPDPERPDHLRLRLKHNPDAAEYDELPLEKGASHREWVARLSRSEIQNGFKYRVAGGDFETPEYEVRVCSRPIVKAFEVEYEYPAATRMAKEIGHEPRIVGYRGTQVTLTTKTNRKVKNGRLFFAERGDSLSAEITEDKESLRFKFTLENDTTYRLDFVSSTDEIADLTPSYPIKVLHDQAPTVSIITPTEDIVTLPVDGQLKIDGIITDDFGIAGASLQMKLHSRLDKDGKLALRLPAKPFRGGSSFKSDADGSFPNTLEYKDSILFKELRDREGNPYPISTETELEYWLEATDTCDSPRKNVGASVHKRIRFVPAPPEPARDKKVAAERAARQDEEQKWNEKQERDLKQEKRSAPPPLHKNDGENPKAEPQEQPKQGEAQPKQGEGQPKQGEGQPKQGEGQPKQGEGQQGEGQPKQGEDHPKQGEGQPKGGEGQPKQGEGQPKQGEGQPKQGEGQPEKGPSSPQTQREIDQKSQRVADEIAKREQEEKSPGQSRPDEAARPDAKPSGSKPQEPGKETAETKSGEKGGEASEGKEQPASPPSGEERMGGEKGGEAKPQQPTERAKGKTGPGENSPQSRKSSDSQGEPAESKGNNKTEGEQPEALERPEDRNLQRKKQNPEDLARELGDSKSGTAATSADEEVERLVRNKAKDLNSPDASKRRKAEEEFNDILKPKERERLQQAAKDRESGDAEKRRKAEEEVEGLVKKGAKNAERKKQREKELSEAAKNAEDLNSNDPQQRDQAEKNLDNKIGKQNRQALQKAMNDEKEAAASREQAKEAAARDLASGKGEPTPDQVAEAKKQIDQLGSDDPKERKAAEEAIDRKVGQEKREQLQKAAQEQKAEKGKSELARKEKLDQLVPKQTDPNKLENDAKAAASDDKGEREKAQQQLEKNVGKEQAQAMKEAAESAQKAEAAGDKAKAEAENRRLEKMAEKAAEKNARDLKQGEELARAAKDLNSNDPKKREAAEKKMDEMIGKGNREKAQQEAKNLENDLKSGDPAKQQAAKDKIEQMAKEMKQQADKAERGQQEAKAAEAEKAIRDLNSNDLKKREAAEKKMDEMIGKGNREKAQQEAKKLEEDLQSNDPAKREAAEEKAREMAKQLQNQGGKNPGRLGQGGGEALSNAPGEKAETDPKNRLRTAELQLTQFEKHKGDKSLQDKLGMTPEEYERFLAECRKRVEELRQEVDKAAIAPDKHEEGPASLRIGEGSGGKKAIIEGNKMEIGGAGPGASPTEYNEAKRRFAEEAAKLRRAKPRTEK